MSKAACAAGAAALCLVSVPAISQTRSFDVLPDRDIWECDEHLYEAFREKTAHDELETASTEYDWQDWSGWFDDTCGLGGVVDGSQVAGFVLGFAALGVVAVAASGGGGGSDSPG